MLTTTTLQLWPENSYRLLKEHKINAAKLLKRFGPSKIWFAWDDAYDQQRQYYSLRIQIRPLFIVKPDCDAEIEYILEYVKRKQLTIAIVNGRHSSKLISPQVLLDISTFDSIKLCKRNNVLKVGGGLTQGQANAYLFNKKGLEIYSHFGKHVHPQHTFSQEQADFTDAFPGGSAASVGVSGISSIGGIGTLKRTYGLTIDSVRAFKITIPPTRSNKHKAETIYVHKNSEEYSDLFYALTGGGANNFGVVTKIYYDIIVVPEIIEYVVNWDWENAKNVLDEWQRTSPARTNQFNEDIGTYAFTDSVTGKRQRGIGLTGFYVLGPQESVEEAQLAIRNALQTLLEPYNGSLTINEQVPYSKIYRKLVATRTYYNFSIIQALFVQKFDAAFIVSQINASYNDLQGGNTFIALELLGGKIKENKSLPSATSFAFRDANFFLDISCNCAELSKVQSIEKWCENTLQTLLLQEENQNMYVGFPITFSNIAFDNGIYYGKSYDRLKAIKKKYDFFNVLTATGTIS